MWEEAYEVFWNSLCGEEESDEGKLLFIYSVKMWKSLLEGDLISVVDFRSWLEDWMVDIDPNQELEGSAFLLSFHGLNSSAPFCLPFLLHSVRK